MLSMNRERQINRITKIGAEILWPARYIDNGVTDSSLGGSGGESNHGGAPAAKS